MKTVSEKDTNIFGVATVGERGQIVIPSDARKISNLQPGEKVVVIGHPPNALMLIRMDAFKPFLSSLNEDFANLESKLLKETSGEAE